MTSISRTDMRFRLSPLLRAALPLLSAAALLAPAPARAQGGPPPAPLALDTAVRVVLLTMGPGDQVWEKFGHNAIWIHDPRRGTDLAYNYGMFDFQQENFLSNFIRGKMLYWMEGFDAYRTLDHYRSLNRTVWAQELNLTPQQAASLRDYLEKNNGLEYLYDYYRDNCSTRVRDDVDRVLGGALKAASQGESGSTYRWHTRRLTSDGDAATYTGLVAGLGPAADREISRWEEMFLPMKLRDGVRALRVRDASGALVPLVKSEQMLFEAQQRPAERSGPPSARLFAYLAIGLVVGGLLAFLATRAAASRGARFGFAAVSGLWLLFAGTGGLILLGLWLFTDHSIAYRNENLFQLSPLALPLVVLVPALAYGSRWASAWAARLALAVAALSVLGFVLQVLPGIDQVNGEIIALALPINLALAWAARRLAGSLPPGGAGGATRTERRHAVATA